MLLFTFGFARFYPILPSLYIKMKKSTVYFKIYKPFYEVRNFCTCCIGKYGEPGLMVSRGFFNSFYLIA